MGVASGFACVVDAWLFAEWDFLISPVTGGLFGLSEGDPDPRFGAVIPVGVMATLLILVQRFLVRVQGGEQGAHTYLCVWRCSSVGRALD